MPLMRFLITAGPTREAIDPVRYLTNHSSGKMGYCLAEAAVHEGHSVLLISGPTSLDIPHGVDFLPVECAREMYDAVKNQAPYADAAILTTPWDQLDGKTILSAIEKVSLSDELLEKMRREHELEEAEHEHEHHHDHDEHDEHDHEHEHHHDHDEDDDHDEHEHHHEHDHDDHEHHHHHHDGEECDDPACECHHHHHHADDVFSSWGKETPKLYSKAALDDILTKLDSGDYGHILRAKGIVNGEGGWLEFDYVPEEHEVRAGHPDYTGRLCVIGAELKEDSLAELFGV